MLCAGQQLAYCVTLLPCSTVLFSVVHVYVFYEQINDDEIAVREFWRIHFGWASNRKSFLSSFVIN